MAEKLTIIFDYEDKGLKNHLDSLSKSQKKLKNTHSPLVAAQNKVNKSSKKLGKGMLDLQHKGRNLDNAFSVLRSKLLLASFGMALAIKPMLRLADVASRQEESLNKANVVFGENISVIKKWADSLGSSVGRANSTLIDMASSLQDTFVPLGFARNAAAQLSTSMTKLALDVASFNNKADADVMRDFQSAIVGNHETVRKYGIIITEANLKQEAFRLGIHKGKGDLTASAKVQARLSLITKGSADAIGDLSRTQTSYANKLKKFNEQMKEFGETIGNMIIPALSKILGIFQNTGTIAAYGVAIVGVGAAYVAVTHAASAATMATRAFMKASKIGLLISAAVGIAEMTISFFGFREHVEDATGSLNDAEDAIANAQTGFSNLSEVIKEQEKAFKDEKAVLEDLIEISNRNLGVQLSQKEETLKNINAERELLRIRIAFNENQKENIGLSEKNQEQQTRLRTAWANANTELVAAKAHYEKLNIAFKKTGLESKEEYDARMLSVLSLKRWTDATNKAKEELDNFNPAVETEVVNIGELKKQYESLGFTIEETQKAIAKLRHAITGMSDEAREMEGITKILTDIGEATGGVSFDMSEMVRNFGETFSELKSLGVETSDALKAAYMEMGAAIAAAMVQAQMAASQARITSIKDAAKADIAAFKQTERYNKMSTKQQKAFEAEKFKVANAAIKREFEAQQKMQRAGVIMNTAAAIMNIWGSPTMGVDPVTKGVLTAFVSALSLAQLEAINSQSAPTMAKGGLIGGRLHSQGGTMINAERGEYVMSRDAVDAVGVETMNRINQGGGSAINVSFTGNVMSEDFIELEAIPKIKEAIRRGADIGVS